MNALSQELFTSSRLPMNQYRGIHSRISFGPFNHLLHERTAGDNIAEPILSHMTLEMRLPAYIGFNVLEVLRPLESSNQSCKPTVGFDRNDVLHNQLSPKARDLAQVCLLAC